MVGTLAQHMKEQRVVLDVVSLERLPRVVSQAPLESWEGLVVRREEQPEFDKPQESQFRGLAPERLNAFCEGDDRHSRSNHSIRNNRCSIHAVLRGLRLNLQQKPLPQSTTTPKAFSLLRTLFLLLRNIPLVSDDLHTKGRCVNPTTMKANLNSRKSLARCSVHSDL